MDAIAAEIARARIRDLHKEAEAYRRAHTPNLHKPEAAVTPARPRGGVLNWLRRGQLGPAREARVLEVDTWRLTGRPDRSANHIAGAAR